MKEFWGKAGAAVRVAFDERDERIREKLIRYGIPEPPCCKGCPQPLALSRPCWYPFPYFVAGWR